MKRFAALLVMALAAIGASACDDNPNDPDDDIIVFRATMTGAEEVPPASGAEAGATGTATITFNVTRGAANAITAATANFSATVSNMPAGSTLILAHIHPGVAGQTGSPIVDTGLTAATAIPIVNGTATLTFNNVTIANPATAQSIIDNPAAFYFNVHSAANPSGVVRGQLVRQGS